MKRNIVRVSGVAIIAAAMIAAWSGSAFAGVTGYELYVGPPTTGAKITSGTGQMNLRSWQICETSNGQTNWYVYGPTVHIIGVWSITSSCTYVHTGGLDRN